MEFAFDPTGALVAVAFGVITAFLAARKGYNPALWFLAAGCVGLVILAFLPFTNKPGMLPDQRASLERRGNVIGGVISAVAALLLLAMIGSSC